MDKGAHYYKCDFQVHTIRDTTWEGIFHSELENFDEIEAERHIFAKYLIENCRRKGIEAIAITDHNDICLHRYIRKAANEELKPDGSNYPENEKLIIFPGIELTLSNPPCQCLLLFDPEITEDALNQVWGSLGITPTPSTQVRYRAPESVSQNFDGIHRSLNKLYINPSEPNPRKRISFEGHYILLPHVSDGGHKTLLRTGFQEYYANMTCVGGYIEKRLYCEMNEGERNILEGKTEAYGYKKLGIFQTSDNRKVCNVSDEYGSIIDFPDLGKWPTWVKWTEPTAEALRQACISKSRLSLTEPELPNYKIIGVKVSNSKFLGKVEQYFNPQFNAFIGGRGTGKSSLLEYIRWALCDTALSTNGNEDIPNFAKRRQSLIENTLKVCDATVTVFYEKLNSVYQITRSSNNISDSVDVLDPDGTTRSISSEQARREFPIVGYAQKQLSNVSTLPNEVRNLVIGSIYEKISEKNREISEIALPLLKEERRKSLRKKQLEEQILEVDLSIKSKRTQIQDINDSILNISKTEKEVLDKHTLYGKEIEWLDEMESNFKLMDNSIIYAYKTISSISNKELNPATPNYAEIIELNNLFNNIKESLTGALEIVHKQYEDLTKENEDITKKIRQNHKEHLEEYQKCIEKSHDNSQKVKLISSLEYDITNLNRSLQQFKNELNALINIKQDESAWDKWLRLNYERFELINSQCREINRLGQEGNRLIVKISPNSDINTIKINLEPIVSMGRGIRDKDSKTDALSKIISESTNPLTEWVKVNNEFESLYLAKGGMDLPKTPILESAGFTQSNLISLRDGLNYDIINDFRYVQLEDHIIFTYILGRNEDGTYIEIPFEQASLGQQSTCLLKTLLSRQGPPLLIDQPEEDLGNNHINIISDQICNTKNYRQLIFVSHSANIVVNGDAEQVICFGNPDETNLTKGGIIEQGSIDYKPIKELITIIMEGGKIAFELRRQKYGF